MSDYEKGSKVAPLEPPKVVPPRPVEQVDTIEVFPRGVKTVGFSSRVGLPDGAGGVRGNIKGWSADSRRRFREWLITHECPTKCYGLTLTIPGDIISSSVWHDVLHALSVRCSRADVGLVWRLETQTRGQAHLHCIASSIGRPQSPNALRGAGPSEETLRLSPKMEYAETLIWWRQTWANIIDKYTPKCSGLLADGDRVFSVVDCPRSLLVGADRHMVDLSPDTGGSVWWRYLCDHATKSKQAQVCGWEGVRHWGRINATAFRSVSPEVWTVERRVFVPVYRWIRNSTRRRIPEERCPFGSKKGVSPRRSCAGASVWFGVSPSLVPRLLALASENYDQNMAKVKPQLQNNHQSQETAGNVCRRASDKMRGRIC